MALSISPVDPAPAFHSPAPVTVTSGREIASARKSEHDEEPHGNQKNVQPPTQVDRVEISQRARQQAQAAQTSSANPGADQQASSPFDTE